MNPGMASVHLTFLDTTDAPEVFVALRNCILYAQALTAGRTPEFLDEE